MTDKKWMIAAKRADFNEIARTFGIDPLTARLIRNRGAVEKDEIQRYLYGTMEDLGDPYAMRDMDKAVGLTMKEIAGGARIRVIGDYDVDGVMASYILLTPPLTRRSRTGLWTATVFRNALCGKPCGTVFPSSLPATTGSLPEARSAWRLPWV